MAKKLTEAYQLLAKHEAELKPPPVDHPGGEYYDYTIENKTFRMVRCKHCGKEMSPKGFKRHYKSPACEAARAQRLGLTPPTSGKKNKGKGRKESAKEESAGTTTEATA
jgi:hypothetical protein